jgi:hypothetical protein
MANVSQAAKGTENVALEALRAKAKKAEEALLAIKMDVVKAERVVAEENRLADEKSATHILTLSNLNKALDLFNGSMVIYRDGVQGDRIVIKEYNRAKGSTGKKPVGDDPTKLENVFYKVATQDEIDEHNSWNEDNCKVPNTERWKTKCRVAKANGYEMLERGIWTPKA